MDHLKWKLNERIQRHADGTIERWRDIPGFVGYYRVSDMGRVKSITRRVKYKDGRQRTVPGKIRPVFSAEDGRKYVNLGKKNKWKFRRVHQLVLITFVGECPEGMEGCHWDGDPSNNRLSNLRWDTRAGNMKDCVRHGTLVIPNLKGESIGNSKIKNAQIPEIHAAYAGGKTSRQIAEDFGVDKGTILEILNGRTFIEHQPKKRAVIRKPGVAGERHRCAKLKASDIPDIIESYRKGETQASIARRYEVASCTINNIIHGRIWKSV